VSVLASFLFSAIYLHVIAKRDERGEETSGVVLACVAMVVALAVFVLVSTGANGLV
jgi:hypothetical protein